MNRLVRASTILTLASLFPATALRPVEVPEAVLNPDPASCTKCHGDAFPDALPDGVLRLFSQADRGVGVTFKGELSNVCGNFGLLSDFHFFAPALHWPSEGSDVQQYGFGIQFMVAVGGNVIKSVADPRSQLIEFDWEAVDGSKGNLFSDVRTEANTASDGTPYLAHSDIRSSWPLDSDGFPFWPGPFRIDIDPESQTFGEQVEGEFTSDSDILGIFDDAESDQDVLGIETRQMTYSYGRPYGEDFIFMDFIVYNRSDETEGVPTATYDSVYVAVMADTKEDFNNDDLIGTADIWQADEHTLGDFFFEWDSDGTPQNTAGGDMPDWVGPVATIGIGAIHTPAELGVTNFHFFDDAYSPVTDEEFWALIISDPGNPAIDSSLYFHGGNVHFDSDSLNGEFLDPDPTDPYRGADITYLFSTGPFTLAPGDSARFSIVFVAGSDSSDLWENTLTAFDMGKEREFQGSSPPPAPFVSATPGDRQVTVFWDGEKSESARDPLTQVTDFEGYKVYKSTDRGRTWGDRVTDFRGETVGWVPLAQFDLADSVTGPDPLGYGYLGDDTGLMHSYIDTDVMNGFEYWYAVTSYDRGDTARGEPSYENAPGNSTSEQHTISVTPQYAPEDVLPGSVSGDTLDPVQGKSDGTVVVSVIDPFAITGDRYEITFNDSGTVVIIDEDTVTAPSTTMNLYNLTAGTDRFVNEATGETFTFRNLPIRGDNLPVIDGFRIHAVDLEEPGLSSMGWTQVTGIETTFDWWTEVRTDHPWEFEEVIVTNDDWMIQIREPDDVITVPVTDGPAFSGTIAEYIDIPIRVYRITDPDNPVDVSEYIQIIDLRVFFPDSDLIGPLGWDLIPGGNGYNPNPFFGNVWPDLIRIRDNQGEFVNEMWLRTQNGPDTATPPSPGDEFTIETLKSFSSSTRYVFSTSEPEAGGREYSLDDIRVVPNPYIVRAAWEEDQYNRKLAFTHLPAGCTIDIYTLAGDHVSRIHHDDSSGQDYWDLKNNDGQNVAYGLYVYVVKTSDGKKKIGKFLVIK